MAIDDSSPPKLVVGVSVSTGIPGLISLVAEHVSMFGATQSGFFCLSLSTPVAYACYVRSPARHGALELGVCAPYMSYGRGHPWYGTRFSVFIPLVCGVAITGRGGVGASCQIPFFGPFLRIGFSGLIFVPGLSTPISRLFALADSMIARAKAYCGARVRVLSPAKNR